MKNQAYKYEAFIPTKHQSGNVPPWFKHAVYIYTYGDTLAQLFDNVGFQIVDADGEDYGDPDYTTRILSESDKAAIVKWFMLKQAQQIMEEK